MRARVGGSEATRTIASAKASADPAAVSSPVTPLTITSRFPPTSVATAGRPDAMASSRAIETPSLTDDSTNTSASARSGATSAR
jgi:hypothetical protein